MGGWVKKKTRIRHCMDQKIYQRCQAALNLPEAHDYEFIYLFIYFHDYEFKVRPVSMAVFFSNYI